MDREGAALIEHPFPDLDEEMLEGGGAQRVGRHELVIRMRTPVVPRDMQERHGVDSKSGHRQRIGARWVRDPAAYRQKTPFSDPTFWVASGPLTVDIVEDNLKYMRTKAPLLAPIFRSEGQARLLATLLLTGDELSITDLAKQAGLAYPTVHREVARLVDAGILSERQVGRTRLIRANDESPLVGPLREILTVASGPVVMLTEELGRIDGIESAFLYGSFAARMLGDAGPTPHDIDVMVLGEPDVDAVYEACTRVEAAVHRPVNPTILTAAEFGAPSGFLDTVRSGPAVAVIGELP